MFVVGVETKLTLVLTTYLTINPIAHSRAEDAAQRRNLRVEIKSVHPNILSITLKDVRFAPNKPENSAPPWISNRLDRIDVHFDLNLKLRSVTIQNNQMNLTDSPEEMNQRVRD